jgi:hypothetical protein
MGKKRTYEAVASRTSGSWTMHVRGVDDLLVNAVMLEYAHADLRRVLAARLGVMPDSFDLDIRVEKNPISGDQ